MIDLPNLRDYQLDFVAQLRQAMRSHNRVIACMPTGAGKSTVAKYIIGSSYNRGTGKAVIAVHRRGLVDNIVDTFERQPYLPHGIIMAGRDTDWKQPVQVASVDTLLSWHVSDAGYNSKTTFDLVCMDEAHSHNSKFAKWLEAHDEKRIKLGLKPAFVIGLTATPMAKGLSQVYQEIVKGPTVQWLIDQNFLVPFRYFQARHLGRLDKLKKQGQGFTDKSLQEAFDGLAGDMVKDWKEKADGRPTVGFFSRLSHAREAMATLNANGIAAEYIDGETSDERRRILFDGLQNGDYQYLCNVGIVDRGTDIPAIGCIQLCTAVGSITRLIQILGRGARPHAGKSECICIDHGGSINRLNTFFEDDIEWVLKAEREKDLKHEGKPVINCPQCGVQYRGGTCRACGYSPTLKERKSQGLEFVGGELVEIKKREKTTKRLTCEQLLVNALYRAGKSGRTWKQAWGLANSEAKKQGMMFRVPAKFQVGGKVFESIPYGDPNGARRVSSLFDGVFG
jgi:DNA repair protein RadD